jgi:hypothetical protein
MMFVVLTPAASWAACNARCQQLCQQDPGPQSVPNCIKLWGCINEKYGAAAVKFVNQAPPPECARFFKPGEK